MLVLTSSIDFTEQRTLSTTTQRTDNPDLDVTWPEPEPEPEPKLELDDVAAVEGMAGTADAAAVAAEAGTVAPVAAGEETPEAKPEGATASEGVETLVASTVSREKTDEGHRVVSMVTSP